MGRGSRASIRGGLNAKSVLFNHSNSVESKKARVQEEKKLEAAKIITGNYEQNGFLYQWFRYPGELHREGDLPAVYNKDTGEKRYYIEGKTHREGDQPAWIIPGKIKAWMLEGLCHREDDQPAIIYDDGQQQWYHGGVEHRDYLPAYINPNTGAYRYSYNGNRHRDNGPAEKDEYGNLFWYKHGKLHREDGPAVITYDGREEYFLEGESLGKIED